MSSPAKDQTELGRVSPYNCADAVIASLLAQDVEVVFGMVGGAIMPVYDALFKNQRPRHIMVGHEQGAAHMADGYARATGKAGVVLTTSGPGATNLVTGLANAMMDSIPMVAITGQVSSNLLGNDAFQEADMWGITMAVTKHNYQVIDVADISDVMAEAFYVAMSGRPGPVLIDLPRDVALTPCDDLVSAPAAPGGYQTVFHADSRAIEQALEMLHRAERPVILAGGGVIGAGASEELRALAEAAEIPVTSTLMGLGNFPYDHPLSLGMPGMHGTGYANLALHHSDVLLCVGSRLDDRITGALERFAPDTKLIHIDIDDSEINKIMHSAVSIVGDARPALKALLAGVAQWEAKPERTEWMERIAAWKQRFPMTYAKRDDVLSPAEVVETMGRVLPEETVLVTGVGQHQMFAAQYYPFKHPRSFITSGGLGTMGFGLPAALGAKIGQPDRPVVCIDGDGSFLMNIQELTTAVRYNIGMVSVILNNTYLGMVRQWQDLFLDGRRSQTELAPPPYDQVAKSFGGLGRRVTSRDELEQSLRWALAQAEEKKLPVVLDVATDPDAHVLPIVPPGAANVEFIPCESGEE